MFKAKYILFTKNKNLNVSYAFDLVLIFNGSTNLVSNEFEVFVTKKSLSEKEI